MKVVVIGSGMSGLTAAAALAQAGHQVSVLEQADEPGGVTAGFTQEGFRWDLGQLLIEGLGPDEPTGETLAALGVLERLEYQLDDRGYVFPDFELRKPLEYGGLRWRIELLKRLFPQEAAGLERYWRDYLRFTRLMTLARRAEKHPGLSARAGLTMALLPFLSRKDWSAQRLMNNYFESEQLKGVFISILADFFTPPSQFIGLGVFALNAEITFEKRIPRQLGRDTVQLGQYSLRGGTRPLVEALVAQIEAFGGKVYTSRPASRILVEGGSVAGVMDAAGERWTASVVVASGGARETFLGLVGPENLPAEFLQKVQSIPLMDSIFMLHLGVDFDPAPSVHGPVTYYYGSYDVEGEIRTARRGEYHEGKAGFVVHVPTYYSPEMAPAGQHSLTVYTIAPDRLSSGSWTERKAELAERLLGYAELAIPGLRAHIRTQSILTPEDFRARTHTRHHAFGGIAPIQGAWRVPHETPLPGLWFVGAQSESGGGVGAVIPAAYKTALRILKAD